MKKLFITSIFIAIVFASCKKYEEGPSISFRSRKERVANTWIFDKILVDGEDATAQLVAAQIYTINTRYIFTKDGDATLNIPNPNNTIRNGEWQFENKDEEIIITYENSATTEHWKIIKLKEDELWIRLLDVPAIGDAVWELHFKPV